MELTTVVIVTNKYRREMAALQNLHLAPEDEDDLYKGYDDFQVDVRFFLFKLRHYHFFNRNLKKILSFRG